MTFFTEIFKTVHTVLELCARCKYLHVCIYPRSQAAEGRKRDPVVKHDAKLIDLHSFTVTSRRGCVDVY